MKKSQLIKKLQGIEGDPEIVLGTSVDSSEMSSETVVTCDKVIVEKKFKLINDVENLEDGLIDVIVISDEYFIPVHDDSTEKEFREDFE